MADMDLLVGVQALQPGTTGASSHASLPCIMAMQELAAIVVFVWQTCRPCKLLKNVQGTFRTNCCSFLCQRLAESAVCRSDCPLHSMQAS